MKTELENDVRRSRGGAKLKRKIIQIAVSPEPDDSSILFALCDDGTLLASFPVAAVRMEASQGDSAVQRVGCSKTGMI